MEIETVIVALIGIFAVLLIILAFGEIYGGEWAEVAEHVTSVIIAVIVFASLVGAISFWRGRN